MPRPTIQEIKQKTRHGSPYFFSRDTMRTFGQTMRSFMVKESPSGRLYIYAPRYAGERFSGYTFREVGTDQLLLVCKPDWGQWKNEQEILEYIREN